MVGRREIERGTERDNRREREKKKHNEESNMQQSCLYHRQTRDNMREKRDRERKKTK